MQHIQPQVQIELKEQILLEQLKHFAHIEPKEILPPLTGPVWGYRRKARLGVKYVPQKKKVLVGFREKNGRYLTDMNECAILHSTVGSRLVDLQALIYKMEARDSIPQIEVAIGDEASVLIFRHLNPLSENDTQLLIEFGQQHTLHIFLQPGNINSIHALWPVNPKSLSYTLPDFQLTLHFSPADFTQVNMDINREMIKNTIALLEPTSTDRILDLFCGLGNFTLPLARFCKEIVGVEGASEMVERAEENAKLNHLTNTTFYAANLAGNFSEATWAKEQFNKIILDPPRTGALEIIHHLPVLGASRIVYVSCNPSTLARDAGILANYGYCLTKVGVMDMFPHTRHVESIAVFDKKK
ncbi:MAG: 23S rRNA (uracil(1939)-C(5))-methyltransferase RlmD [Legionellaceae bacterium]